MSTLSRGLTRPMVLLGGIGCLLVMSVALIWLHLPPEMMLGLIVGSFSLLVLALRPLLGVYAFLALLYVENFVPTIGGLTGTKLIGATILAGWLLSLAVQRRAASLRLDAFVVVLVFFVAWSGVSLAYAFDTRVALVRVFTFAQLATATLMFSAVVDDPRKIRGVYWTVVLATCASTVVALGQYYLGLTIMAKGLVGNRNLLAGYINVAIVLAYVLYQATPNRAARLVLASILPLLFLGLFLTFSRAGLVVLSLTLLLVWYRVARQKGFFLLVISAILLSVIVGMLPADFWRRASSIVPAIQRQEGTFGLRIKLWKVGMRMVQDRPVTGVGPANFIVAFPRYARGQMVTRHLVAHSAYVGIASEMGLVGLALFLLLHVLALRQAGQAIRAGKTSGSKDLAMLAVGAEVCIIVVMVGGITGSSETLKLLWILFGLAGSLGRMTSRSVARGEELIPRRADPWLEEAPTHGRP